MKRKFIIIFILFMSFVIGMTAQNSIRISVFGNGGQPISNSSYHLNGTAGQTFTGINSGTNQKAYVGFWNTIEIPVTGVNDEFGNNFSNGILFMKNFPNPFNSKTTISYRLADDSHINIAIYNILGEKIATLLDETKQAGEYSVNWNTDNNLTGTYFCRLIAGDKSETITLELFR